VKKTFPEATERELEDAMAKWLTGSRDRDGGKKERSLREADRREMNQDW